MLRLRQPWPEILLLFYSIIAYSGLLLFELYRQRPNDPAAYDGVSFFYGPGVYLGWYLVAGSILIKGPTLPEEDERQENDETGVGLEVGPDLLSVAFYVGAVLGWCIFRTAKRYDPELEAGLIVLEAAADMVMPHVFLRSKYRSSKVFVILVVLGSMWCHNLAPKTDYAASSVVTAMVLVYAAAIATEEKGHNVVPRSRGRQRLLIVLFLTTVWICDILGFGTYQVMPRVGEHMITPSQLLELDQMAPLVAAVLTVAWSWRAEIKQLPKSIWMIAKGWARRGPEQDLPISEQE